MIITHAVSKVDDDDDDDNEKDDDAHVLSTPSTCGLLRPTKAVLYGFKLAACWALLDADAAAAVASAIAAADAADAANVDALDARALETNMNACSSVFVCQRIGPVGILRIADGAGDLLDLAKDARTRSHARTHTRKCENM